MSLVKCKNIFPMRHEISKSPCLLHAKNKNHLIMIAKEVYSIKNHRKYLNKIVN